MYLYVPSGLMSRCVAMTQMYQLLKEHKRKELTIIWPSLNGCAIGFWDVFDTDIFS